MSASAPITLLRSMDKPAAFIDPGYRLQYFNESFAIRYGIQATTPNNIPFSVLTGETWFNRHLKPHLDLCMEGVETQYQVPVKDANESGQPAEGDLIPHYDHRGGIEGVLLIHPQNRDD